MTEIDNIKRGRFLIGISASIVLHVLLFIVFQYLISFNLEKPREFRGAITVTLQELVPQEGAVKQANLPKTVKSPIKSVKKTDKVKSVAVQKVKKQVLSQQNTKKQITSVQSKPKQIVNKPPASINKPQKTPEGFRKFSTGEAQSELQKGEVKTLSTKKGNVSVIPKSVQEVKKKEKPLPFKPGVKIEESPLAFNIGELENKNTGNETTVKEKEVAGKSAIESTISAGKSVKSNSLIEWEKGAQERKVISMGPKPRLPDWVKKEGFKLKVTLIFKVTPDGYVTDIKVFRSSGYSDVDAAIMESVRRILFEPVQSSKPDTAKITYIIEPK